MNLLFRVLIGFGALVVCALFALLIAPFWIDWEHYKKEFEAIASDAIGQTVSVTGATSIRILPLPYFSFQQLAIGENPDGSPLMTVEDFSINAELIPLLSGDLRIVGIEMNKPVINLNVDDKGQIAWTSPKSLPVAPENIQIETINVVDGSGNITGLSGGRTFSFDAFNGTVSAKSLVGPWRVDGQLVFEGSPTKLAISTGSYQASSKSIRVKTEIETHDLPYRFALNGPMGTKDHAFGWQGEFEVLPLAAKELEKRTNDQQPLPIDLSGKFNGDFGKFTIGDYRLEIGEDISPYVVTGSADVKFGENPNFRVIADGRQIQIDRLGKAAEQNKALSDRERLNVLNKIISQIPVPNMRGVADISLPAVVAGDTIIRDINALVSPEGAGWQFKKLSALLPGSTSLRTSGRLDVGEGFGYNGELLLASRQPSGLVNWLGGDITSQVRQLKRIGLDAQVVFTKNQSSLEAMELRLDDAVLRGKMRRLSPPTGRPAISADLSGNVVNTDTILALFALVNTNADNDLAGHHLNIAIDASTLITEFQGVPIQASDVDAKFHMADGSVSIERMKSSDFFGAKITSGGKISDLTNRPNGNITLALQAEDGRRLFKFINDVVGGAEVLRPFIEHASLSKNTTLDVELDASRVDEGAKGRLVLKGDVGGSKLEAFTQFTGEFSNVDDLPTSFNARLENPSIVQLLRQFGVETLANPIARLPEEKATLVLSLDGSLGGGYQTDLSLSGDETNVNYKGDLTLGSSGVTGADGSLNFVSKDLVPYLNLVGVGLPISTERALPVSFKTKLGLGNNVSEFSEVAGQLADNKLTGNVTVDTAGDITKLNGDLVLSRLDLATVLETVLGRIGPLDLVSGQEPEMASVFGSPIYPALDAKLKLTAEKISATDHLRGRDARADLRLNGSVLTVSNLEFNALDGMITAAGNISNNDGVVTASANYNVAEVGADEFFKTAQVEGIEKGSLSTSGSVEATGGSLSDLVENLSGNGVANLRQSTFSGLNTQSFPDMLVRADEEGFKPEPKAVASLVKDHLFNADYQIDSVEVPYSFNRGKVRLRNVRLKDQASDLTANLELGLISANVQSDVLISYKPERREVIAGTTPAVRVMWEGDLEAPAKSVDTSAIEGYFSLRAFEQSQRRLETLEARVIEKQRLQSLLAYNRQRTEYETRLEEEAKALAIETERRAEEDRAAKEQQRLQEEQEAEAERLKREGNADENVTLPVVNGVVEEAPVEKPVGESALRQPEQEPVKPAITQQTLEPVQAKPEPRARITKQRSATPDIPEVERQDNFLDRLRDLLENSR